jgi:hypothetical protein
MLGRLFLFPLDKWLNLDNLRELAVSVGLAESEDLTNQSGWLGHRTFPSGWLGYLVLRLAVLYQLFSICGLPPSPSLALDFTVGEDASAVRYGTW